MSQATVPVDRRAAKRDRRLFGDRRSSVLPNLTDHSRRIAIQDRRSGVEDRRVRSQVTAMTQPMPILFGT
ncbi:MAG: hypothetical protein QNJ85_15265 [Gammaproteobacteria bacterium]|nr:hypothetical protein [Gammaproteobacteria bacterium]